MRGLVLKHSRIFSHLAVCYYHIDCLLCFSFLFLNVFYYFKVFEVTYMYFDFASIYRIIILAGKLRSLVYSFFQLNNMMLELGMQLS